MAGYNPSEPRNKQGEWTGGGGSKRAPTGRFTSPQSPLVKGLKKVGIAAGLVNPPRKHKAGYGKNASKAVQQQIADEAARHKAALEAQQEAGRQRLQQAIAGHGVDILAGGVAGAVSHLTGVGIKRTHRTSGPASMGHGASALNESGYGLGGTVQKIPNHATRGDATFFHLNVKIGKETKKKRPTFPQGYNKRGAEDY